MVRINTLRTQLIWTKNISFMGLENKIMSFIGRYILVEKLSEFSFLP